MSAEEVLAERPAWEIDVLIEQWNEQQREAERAAGRRRR